MNLWIVIAFDPVPGIDLTARMLRYGTLAERALAAGHSVTFWTSTYNHFDKAQRTESEELRQLQPSGLNVQFLRGESYAKNISLSRIRHNRSLARRFSAIAPTHAAPDVVFAGIPCLELAESAALFCMAQKIPYVADIQDIWPEVYLAVLPRAFHPLGRLLLRREYARAKRIFDACRAITAVSQRYLSWAQTVAATTRPADAVFYLGYRLPEDALLLAARANAEYFAQKHRIPLDRPLVTFLGQFAASYDVETIAHAARILHEKQVSVHLVLAGKGVKFDRVKAIAKELPNITLTGWLEYRDSITLLQRSDVGLAAYASSATQSLPYKPFEYMAYGLPIISSLDGELREIIRSYKLGESYRPGDPQSLAAAIEILASGPRRGSILETPAFQTFKRNFDSIVIADQTVQYLENITKI